MGGSCVELEAGERRLVLDVGLPLDTTDVPMRDLLPDVPGLWAEGDGSLEAVLLSHGHPDHCGLADLVSPGVRLLAGEATVRIAREASFFIRSGRELAVDGVLSDGQRLSIGPFAVTPVLVDHSAFDAYALVVEADARRLIYSGDLRAHGRKPGAMSRLAAAALGAEVLLLEGTRVGADGREPSTEADVEARLVEICADTHGLVLAAASAQNVDRLVSLFRAARRSGRELVVDLYAASILAATERPTIPTADSDGVRVFLPHVQRRQVVDARAFERTAQVRDARVFAEELSEAPDRFLMLFRASMARDLERAGCLDGAELVWSMWSGYLDRDERLRSFLDAHSIPLRVAHSSGHAGPGDLRRFVDAVQPGRVVPMHTYDPEACRRLGPEVELHRDGEWWEV